MRLRLIGLKELAARQETGIMGLGEADRGIRGYETSISFLETEGYTQEKLREVLHSEVTNRGIKNAY